MGGGVSGSEQKNVEGRIACCVSGLLWCTKGEMYAELVAEAVVG